MTEDDIKIAYRNVFASPEAGAVLLDLAILCRFLDTSCLDDSRQWATPEETAFNEGARRVFLRILRFSGLEESLTSLLERRLYVR